MAGMSSPPPPHTPRYPGVEDCTWMWAGKCRDCECRYSLLADRPRFRDWDPDDVEELVAAMPSTCALDFASSGPMLLDEIATFMGLPRPMVEQMELSSTRKLSRLRELRRAHWDNF